MADLSKSIDSIRTATEKLNAVVNEMAKTVRALEDALQTWGVGVPSEVTVENERDDEGVPYFTALAYCRVGQRFRIAVSEGCALDDPDEWSITPWSDCARDRKLKTFAVLPKLVEAIATGVTDRVQEATSAADAVNAVVRALLNQQEERNAGT